MKFLKGLLQRLRQRFRRRADGSQPSPQPQPTTPGRQTQVLRPLPPAKDRFGKFQWIGFIFAVLLPAVLVAWCNYLVFPDSYEIAVGIVLISVGIAGLFTVGSMWATPKVARLIILAHVALMIALSINLAAHWILSREKSGAQQATAARHIEEDRQAAFRRQEAEQQIRLLNAQRDLTAAEGTSLANETRRNNSIIRAAREGLTSRGNVIRPTTPRSSGSSLPSPGSTVGPQNNAADPGRPAFTVEEVMERWRSRLTWLAILDLFTSVIAYGLVAAKWEWDRNRDGIPDHLQGAGSAPYTVSQSQQQPVQTYAPVSSGTPGNGTYQRP
jgi:hypothetical protein